MGQRVSGFVHDEQMQLISRKNGSSSPDDERLFLADCALNQSAGEWKDGKTFPRRSSRFRLNLERKRKKRRGRGERKNAKAIIERYV